MAANWGARVETVRSASAAAAAMTVAAGVAMIGTVLWYAGSAQRRPV